MKIPVDGQIVCPHAGCDVTVHIQKVSVLPRDSGRQMAIILECEDGHKSKIKITDHSGGLWWNHVKVRKSAT